MRGWTVSAPSSAIPISALPLHFPPPPPHNPAMGKRVTIALTVLAVALVSAIVWQVVKPSDEPVYQGMPFSEWITTCLQTNVRHFEVETMLDEAMGHVGTNAIPSLLRLLRMKDSPLKLRLVALAQRQQIIRIEYLPAKNRNSAGAGGFYELGRSAQNAVPALIEIANQNISRDSQYYAVYSLGCIGPAAKEAVPSLLRWTTDTNDLLRNNSVSKNAS